MSASKQRTSRSVLALAILCAFSAQAATAVIGAENYVARAKELIGSLYPGLDDNLQAVIVGHRLRDHGFTKPDIMNRFTMELYSSQPVRRSNAPS